MNNRKPLICVLLGATLLSAASGQVTKSGSGYLFRVKYVKGQLVKLATSSTVGNIVANPGDKSSKPISMVMKVDMSMKALSIQKGVATMQLTIGPSMVGGMQVQPGQSLTVMLDDRNQSSSSAATSLGLQYPRKPVSVGQTWSAVTGVNLPGKGISPLKGSYRFSGIKSVSGQQVAVVTYELGGAAQGTGTMMMLVKDGTLFSNDTYMSLTFGDQKYIKIHSVMKRVP